MNLAEYKGVYVFAQQVDNEVSGIALELIGKGKDLAKDLYQSPDWSCVYETAESLAFFDKYLNILKNENPNNLNTVLKLMFTEMKSVQTMSLNTLSQSR